MKKGVKNAKMDYFSMKIKFKLAMSLYYQGEMDQSMKLWTPVKDYLMKLNHQDTKVQHKMIKANFYHGKATLTLMGQELHTNKADYNDALKAFNFCIREDFDPEIHDLYSGNSHFEIAKVFIKERDILNCYDFIQRANDNNFASKRMSLYRDFTEGVVQLMKRKIKKGVQILTDLLEIVINGQHENDRAQSTKPKQVNRYDQKDDNEKSIRTEN